MSELDEQLAYTRIWLNFKIELKHNHYYCLSGSKIDKKSIADRSVCVEIEFLNSGSIILADEHTFLVRFTSKVNNYCDLHQKMVM